MSQLASDNCHECWLLTGQMDYCNGMALDRFDETRLHIMDSRNILQLIFHAEENSEQMLPILPAHTTHNLFMLFDRKVFTGETLNTFVQKKMWAFIRRIWWREAEKTILLKRSLLSRMIFIMNEKALKYDEVFSFFFHTYIFAYSLRASFAINIHRWCCTQSINYFCNGKKWKCLCVSILELQALGHAIFT